MLPLYENDTRNWEILFQQAHTAHIGLLFDKFPHGIGWADAASSYKLGENTKKDFFNAVIKKYAPNTSQQQAPLASHLTVALERQRQLVNQLQGETITVTTDWRFVSGLGASHPFETGFIWHRTLSVPYLPGSSVKGMMRAWAEQWGGLEDQKEINRLFGPRQEQNASAETGAIIVFDALPSKPPKLELDILTPHYSEYYNNPATTPPADYLSPIPVFFLAVAAGQSFEFFLAPRNAYYLNPNNQNHNASDDLIKAKTLLLAALNNLGAGGKTAVGYGQMTGDEYKNQQLIIDAKAWLAENIALLKIDKDLKGQPEENLWKKPLSERWLRAEPAELKPIVLEFIKSKWKELGISWDNPHTRQLKPPTPFLPLKNRVWQPHIRKL